MARRTSRTPRPPLDAARLDELALAYVGRFSTTRSKLRSYLARKIRERGWEGDREADLEAVAERLAGLGYVDDAAYALSKSRGLTARGYGARRVNQSLRAAGVGEEEAAPARDLAQEESVESALRFARKRRIGPFGDSHGDRAAAERALAAMIRAGHSFRLAKAIISLPPGSDIDLEMLRETG